MGLFGRLMGKKGNKIEIDAENMSDDEKLLLATWLKDKRQRAKLVEVDE